MSDIIKVKSGGNWISIPAMKGEKGETGETGIPTNVRVAIRDLFMNAVYSSPNMQSAVETVSEWAYTAAETISLSDSTKSIVYPATYTLTATVTPSNHTGDVEWSSSDETVAVVNNGTVMCVGNGTCTITASIDDLEAECEVTVSGVVNAQVYYVNRAMLGAVGKGEETRLTASNNMYLTGLFDATNKKYLITETGTHDRFRFYGANPQETASQIDSMLHVIGIQDTVDNPDIDSLTSYTLDNTQTNYSVIAVYLRATNGYSPDITVVEVEE